MHLILLSLSLLLCIYIRYIYMCVCCSCFVSTQSAGFLCRAKAMSNLTVKCEILDPPVMNLPGKGKMNHTLGDGVKGKALFEELTLSTCAKSITETKMHIRRRSHTFRSDIGVFLFFPFSPSSTSSSTSSSSSFFPSFSFSRRPNLTHFCHIEVTFSSHKRRQVKWMEQIKIFPFSSLFFSLPIATLRTWW